MKTTKIFLACLFIVMVTVHCSRESAPAAADQPSKNNRSKEKGDPLVVDEMPPAPEEEPDPAMIRIDTAQFKSQIDELSDFIKENPEDAKAYAARGDMRKVVGDIKGACEDWKKAAELGAEFLEKTIEYNCE